MRILHTADWHIGRTFHGHATLEPLREVLGAIPDVVRREHVDLVLVAGDVFDSAAPSGEAFALLREVLVAIREAGAEVILISGNHDSAARLGFAAPFATLAGVHLETDPGTIDQPIAFEDKHGLVDVYCVPFLEPALLRHRWPGTQIRNQVDALRHAMGQIRASVATRAADTPRRKVVVAHTFAAGAQSESADSERPITVGSVDLVPLDTFYGVDYVALGHVHGRATLAHHIRYPGAALHYSFSEAGKLRGGWLVDLGEDGLEGVTWAPLPVPRPLVVLTDELDRVLSSENLERFRDHWVSVVLTDRVRPADAMRRLQERFPWCASVEHRPAGVEPDHPGSYAVRVRGKSDDELLGAFLEHVRNGIGPTPAEAEMFREVVGSRRGQEAVR